MARVNADQSGASVSTAEAETGTSDSGAAADALLEESDGTSLELARSEASMDTRSIENYNAEILKGE